jgi:uncharacterized membrane protein YdjX (TVP38/TMEM64 family)
MKKKGFLLILIVAALFSFFYFDLGQYLTLDSMKEQRNQLLALYTNNPLATIFIYMGIYIAVTALSLPGAAVMTLVGGAIFGVLLGTVVVSFASTIGATLAFLFARFLLRDWVQKKFGSHLSAFNEAFKREGAYYLFTLRLIPAVPFFVINLVMGLTPVKAITFFFVSQVGMLLGTIAYVNAGTQLSQLNSLRGIISPEILLSFVFLGILPLISKKVVAGIAARRVYKGYKRPKSYDFNIVAIGAGSAGLVTSYIAAAVKAKVALVERDKMGGDCLNTGCVPSKALIRSAKVLNEFSRAEEF